MKTSLRASLFAALLCSTSAFAQNWPAQPVRLVVAFAPGGATDVVGRLIAQELTGAWGQQVIVENRAGAGGTIGADSVAKAKPDGYTLYVATLATNATAPSVYSKLPYNPERDFAYIASLGKTSNILLVNNTVPVSNLKELIDWVRANKGKVSYSSPGIGLSGHLGMEIVLQATGMEVLNVPFKGSAPASQAMMSGEVAMSLDLVPTALGYIASGRAKPIAVASDTRSALAPTVPTFREAGGPALEIYTWNGLAAPGGTSRDLVNRIHRDTTTIMKRPDMRDRLLKMGIEPLDFTPEEFAKFVSAESKKWGDVARKVGAKLD